MAESLQYQTEKFVNDNADKLSDEQKSDLNGALAELKSALASDDVAAIKSGVDRVSTLSQQIGASMYSQNQAATEESMPNTDEDIVEGEVVDEDKN
jgi:molecular chaperone DnaK